MDLIYSIPHMDCYVVFLSQKTSFIMLPHVLLLLFLHNLHIHSFGAEMRAHDHCLISFDLVMIPD